MQYIIFIISLSKLLINVLYNIYSYNLITDNEKLSIYENGFDPINNSLMQLDVIYWFIGLIYLIFDLEQLFVFPFISLNIEKSFVSILIFIGFLIILAFGFVFEIINNVIDLI